MRKYLTVTLLLAGLLSSCSPYDKVLKSNDYNLKLEKANEYYDQQKWYRAEELYNQVMPVFRSTKNYEDIFYKYCYTLFNKKDYLSSSYQFKNFVEFFPNSSRAEECEYMHGVSLVKDIDRYQLDPTSTIKAREILVNFVNTHPGSERIPEAMKYIALCTDQLETKNRHAAELYYNMGQYKASIIAFKQVLETFVESKKGDYYTFMRFKSAYKYADMSDASKQEERFVDAIAVYRELKNFYPNSNYLAEAEKLFAIAEKNIKQLRNEHK